MYEVIKKLVRKSTGRKWAGRQFVDCLPSGGCIS